MKPIRFTSAMLIAMVGFGSSAAETTAECTRESRNAYESFTAQLHARNVMRTQDVYWAAKFKGQRIYPAKDLKTFERLGFKPGDLIVDFCGVKLADMRVDTAALCCKGSDDSSIDLTILRENQQEIQLSVPKQ